MDFDILSLDTDRIGGVSDSSVEFSHLGVDTVIGPIKKYTNECAME